MDLKKTFLNIVKFCITFGILYYLYQRGLLDFGRVKKVLTDLPVVAGAFFILLGTTLIAVVRWGWLLVGQQLQIPFAEVLRLSMIGVFFNTAIPGAVSGDVVKGYYVVRQQPNQRGRIKAFTTLLMDRLLGLSALVCVAFVAMVFNFQEMISTPTLKSLSGLISTLWFGVVCFYLFVLVEWSFSSKLRKALNRVPLLGNLLSRFFEAVKAYENSRGIIIKGLLVSIVVHCSIVGVFVLLSKSLGGFTEVPIGKFFFLVPLGLLVTAIPIAPAGLGTGHAAFLWLFQLVGSSAGADLFTAFVTFQILISLIGGLFYLRYRVEIPREQMSI